MGPNRGNVMLQDVCAVPTRERSTEIIFLRSREAGGTWAVSSTYCTYCGNIFSF